jgi:hypothetical protein
MLQSLDSVSVVGCLSKEKTEPLSRVCGPILNTPRRRSSPSSVVTKCIPALESSLMAGETLLMCSKSVADSGQMLPYDWC